MKAVIQPQNIFFSLKHRGINLYISSNFQKMDPIISTITWFECNKLSNTLQDSINGNFKNMIIPRKGRFGYAVLGPGVFRIFISFNDLGNPVTLKYKVWKLNLFRNFLYF